MGRFRLPPLPPAPLTLPTAIVSASSVPNAFTGNGHKAQEVPLIERGEPNVKDKPLNKGLNFNVGIGPTYFAGLSPPPPQKWLIQDLWAELEPALLHGEGGSAKSYIGLAAGICLAAGVPFLGKAVTQRPVGFVDFELSQPEQHRRALAVTKGLGVEDIPATFAYFQCAGYALATVKPYLVGWLEENPGGVFILDSFGAASTGNIKAEDVVIEAMRELRALGAGGLLVLDHQSKLQNGEDYANKSAYGSVYKFNLSRLVWQLELVDSVPGQATVLLRNKKNNFGPKLADMGVDVLFDNLEEAVVLHPADVTKGALSTRVSLDVRIKLALGSADEGKATAKVLAEELSADLASVKARLSALSGRGDVVKVGKHEREVEWGLAVHRAKVKD